MDPSLETSSTSVKSPDQESVPRGVSPPILLEQVRNTAPFLFDGELAELPIVQTLTRATGELSHSQYFRLCLSAHYATVATYVPTDVDNQIRFKLWNPVLPTEVLSEMAAIVLEAASWNSAPLTRRLVRSPSNGGTLSGHQGEWFSVAVAAYSALRSARRNPELAAEVAAAIVRELQREADLYREFRKLRSGIALLQTATIIAHNLGDLDRVIEMWNLPEDDALRAEVFKLGHRESRAFPGAFELSSAGELNKNFMAIENHRNFALRKPRCLRRSADLLIETAPFLDHWGSLVARHPALSPEDVGEVAEALVEGWERLMRDSAPVRGPIGYARALAGILDSFPGGFGALTDYLPARIARVLKSGPLRTLCDLPRRRFEEQWNSIALRAVAADN